jgi:hypothetical protein
MAGFDGWLPPPYSIEILLEPSDGTPFVRQIEIDRFHDDGGSDLPSSYFGGDDEN